MMNDRMMQAECERQRQYHLYLQDIKRRTETVNMGAIQYTKFLSAIIQIKKQNESEIALHDRKPWQTQ